MYKEEYEHISEVQLVYSSEIYTNNTEKIEKESDVIFYQNYHVGITQSKIKRIAIFEFRIEWSNVNDP